MLKKILAAAAAASALSVPANAETNLGLTGVGGSYSANVTHSGSAGSVGASVPLQNSGSGRSFNGSVKLNPRTSVTGSYTHVPGGGIKNDKVSVGVQWKKK